jgi:sugar phosphate isomerase/epimerase
MNQIGIQRIRELAERAEEQNVVLAIENCGRPDYVDFLLSHCDAGSLGLCYDSSHDFLRGMRPTEILKRWGRRLVTTHLSDNCGEHDDHWLPGEGTIDWERVVSCFPTDTCSGPVMLEVVPAPDDRVKAAEFLHKAYTRARRIAEKLG